MTMIVTADEFRKLLAGGDVVAVDVRPEADWKTATIPGAININVYDYFIPDSSEAGVAGMAAGARQVFSTPGLLDGRRPVFFEDRTGMISPRGLWFYELAGFAGGLILDGGYQAWLAAGGESAPGEMAQAAIAQAEPGREAFRRELVATTADVLDHRKTGADIFDVRRRSEFEGTFVHACCARPGRIPDAKFAFFEDMLVDGHYRDPAEIRALAEAAGLSPEREIITYCHRGARAATALYGLRLAGFEKVRIYTGSWHEWSCDASLPVEIG